VAADAGMRVLLVARAATRAALALLVPQPPRPPRPAAGRTDTLPEGMSVVGGLQGDICWHERREEPFPTAGDPGCSPWDTLVAQ
jgi:hypothetical protein